jgi:hypothetical protein
MKARSIEIYDGTKGERDGSNELSWVVKYFLGFLAFAPHDS